MVIASDLATLDRLTHTHLQTVDLVSSVNMKPGPFERLRSVLHIKQADPDQAVSQSSKASKLGSGQIPAEILEIIKKELPVIDQICLALTCKSLYAGVISSLKTKDETPLKLLFPTRKRIPLCRNIKLNQDPRIQLLRRLENPRWGYCVECMRLHPRSAWVQPRRSRKEHYCCSCGILHQQRCMPFAGMVDICPCLSITFNERQLLMASIANASNDSRNQFFDGRFFEEIFYDSKLFHRCKISHPQAKVAIDTHLLVSSPRFRWTDKKTLRVLNCYTFTFSQDVPVAQSLGCPHKDPNKWLKEYFISAGSDYSAWHGVPKVELTEPGRLKILTMRELGYQRWDQRGWKSNRRDCP